MAGAEIVWITPEEYRRRNEIFDRETMALKKQGHTPYVIPEGASNALGAWGYIRAAEELKKILSPPGRNRWPGDHHSRNRFRGYDRRTNSRGPTS